MSVGTKLGRVFATDTVEVTLPLTDSQLMELALPIGFVAAPGQGPMVALTATVGGEKKVWPATMDRVDGEVQRSTLSAYGLAKVGRNADGELPPVGLFVEAKVPGKTLENVVVLPRSAVRGSNEVWVVQDGKLAKRYINILRTSRDEVVARGGFEPGDELVLTRLAAPVSGDAVEAIREDSANP